MSAGTAWSIGRLLAGVWMFGALLWSAHLIARRVLPEDDRGTRGVGTVVVFGSLMSVIFTVLAGMFAGGFRPAVVLIVVTALAIATHRWCRGRGAFDGLCDSLKSGRKILATFGQAERVVLGLAMLLATLRVARGLVMPPLGPDSFLYHLVRAARWARTGAWTHERLPDVGRFLDAYPVGGDVPWAWAMLVPSSDALVGLVSASTWCGLGVATYAVLRRLDVSPKRSALVSVATMMIPAVATQATCAYVDIQVLLSILASAAFFGFARDSGDETKATATTSGVLIGALFVGLSVGLGTAAKLSCAPIAFFAAIAIGARRVRQRDVRGALLSGGAVALGWFFLVGPSLYRTWAAYGNPVYPFPLSVFGVRLEGNELFDLIISAKLFGNVASDTSEFLRIIFVPGLWRGRDETGLGPVPVLLVPFAIAGARHLWRSGRSSLVVYLLAIMLCTLAPFFSAGTLAYRTGFAVHTARFLTPAAAVVLLLAAAAGASAKKNIGDWVLLAALIINVVLSIPHGWSSVDEQAFTRLAMYMLLPVVAIIAAIWRSRGRRYVVAALAMLAMCIVLTGLQWPRRALRYAYYESAANGDTFDLHRTTRQHTSAWNIWKSVDDDGDDGRGHRIAVFSGWDPLGGFWTRYPFFGARLQNDVMYVSPAKTGEVADYRLYDADKKTVQMRVWVRALITRDVDVVVALQPATSFEMTWIRNHPEIFVPWVESADAQNHAYRFDRTAAEAWLVTIDKP